MGPEQFSSIHRQNRALQNSALKERSQAMVLYRMTIYVYEVKSNMMAIKPIAAKPASRLTRMLSNKVHLKGKHTLSRLLMLYTYTKRIRFLASQLILISLKIFLSHILFV